MSNAPAAVAHLSSRAVHLVARQTQGSTMIHRALYILMRVLDYFGVVEIQRPRVEHLADVSVPLLLWLDEIDMLWRAWLSEDDADAAEYIWRDIECVCIEMTLYAMGAEWWGDE